ncbi:diguanylate cyclase domain-containing protein [Methylobacterium sp. CM6247]
MTEKAEDTLVSVTPDSLALPHPGLGDGQCVTVSIGLSLDVGNGDESGFLALVRQADDALYRAKEEGRNRYAAPWIPSTMILNTQPVWRSV